MENKKLQLECAMNKLNETINQLNQATSTDKKFINGMNMRINSIINQIMEIKEWENQ